MPDASSGESGLAAIRRQIQWDRLIAVVEEQAQTMIRTAFSTTVREAGDLSAGIFDLRGRMLAQAVTGTPGHVNSMMESVGHFLAKFPAETMQPGDHYITNDPWLGTGHLHDLTVVTPAFYKGRIVALFANTAHVIDVGGLGMGPEARSVFEEGLYIPIVKCFDRGAERNAVRLHSCGPRRPVELEGDVYSLLPATTPARNGWSRCWPSSTWTAWTRLPSMSPSSSLRATLAAIEKLPRGTYRSEIRSDGYEAPVTLKAAMSVHADRIEVDFSGTSGLSGRGINVPPAYTRAYACFGIKCVVAPDIPNNWASLAPFRMVIPEGCILNAPRPYAVAVRHVVGQLLPDLMMGCLHQAVPDRVTAEGSSCLWNPPLRGGASVSGKRGEAAGLRDHHIQLRRHRRATFARRAGWNGLPLRSAYDAGRGDRERGAGNLLEEGAAPGQRRRRTHARRLRPEHGDRHERRAGVCGECHLRPRREPAERPRRRR